VGYSVSHIIETDVDTFWQLFFDQELAHALVEELGNAGSFEIAEDRTDDQGVRHRRIECLSNIELPDFVKKLMGDGSYTELGRFDSRAKIYSAQIVPKVGGSKLRVQFEITAQPIDDGRRCERRIVVENTVKVLAIGAMLEGLIERTQRDAHDKGAAFMNKWIQRGH